MEELAYTNNSLGQEALLLKRSNHEYAVVVSLTNGTVKKTTATTEGEAWRFWEEIKDVIEEYDREKRAPLS